MLRSRAFEALSAAVLLLLLSGCFGGGSSSSSTSYSYVTCNAVSAAVAQAVSGAPASHIPAVVQNFSDVGKTSEDRELPITLMLTLNNRQDLQQLIHDLYDPTSPSYHQFLTPAQFRDRYSPTADQVAQVTDFLQSHGIHVGALGPNGYMLHATGSIGALNEAFSTEIHEYQDSNGKQYHSPSYEPSLPAGLPISAVHGLQNVTHFKMHTRASAAAAAAAATPMFAGAGLQPSEIKSAYNVPSSVDGSGQTLGLFELAGYQASDISAYETQFSLSAPTLQNILIDGVSGAGADTEGSAEVTLDIELMAALAPGASKIMVYEGQNTIQGVLDVYSRIASDDTAKEISSSWGAPEDESSTSMMNSENTIFQQMASQGQSFYAAAGDRGAYDDGCNLTVDDPASQPYVVAVGGTHLDHTGGTYVSETSWNDGSTGGGGGISSYWSIPSWQSGVASGSNLGSTGMRNVPDVSLEADQYVAYAVYFNGSWTAYGGTSCAAPLWAAFTALVNQQRATDGKGTLGFPNPAIYSIAEGTNYSTDFHDIADASTNRYYPAVSGYDLSTGWGSFQGTSLFNDLVAY